MGERKMCSFEVFKLTYLERRVTIKTYSAKCLAGLLIWCQAELLLYIFTIIKLMQMKTI